jgi:hypothetical protein
MKAFSRLFRFGMTFKPLTDDLGAGLLTWYLGAFRAKTSPAQEEVQASPDSAADSGQKWLGSFARYDLVTSSWKTHQYSLAGDLTEYSETWPRWGLMRNGECLELPTWERRISGIASGSSVWIGTPTAEMRVRSEKWRQQASIPTPAEIVDPTKWPTPTVSGNYNRKGLSKTSGDGIATAVNRRPTPTTTCDRANHNSPSVLNKRHGINLAGAVMRWATPVARDHRTPALSRVERTGSSQGDPLNTQVGGMLNPVWVEWLMGWPLGWTDLRPLEMDKFQQWQQQHLRY